MNITKQKTELLVLAGCVVAALLFWNTLFIYPIKLFVVMLHEISHGLMAIAFGGEIIEIQIDRRIGGYCLSTIPDTKLANIMVASAGYLGSLFWGSVILLFAVKTNADRFITLIIGIVMLVLSYFVIQTGEWFGILVVLGFSLTMFIAFKFVNQEWHDLFLKFIGITSCLYVVLDIKSDLIDRTGIGSDADKIAEITGISSTWIGYGWITLAVIVVFLIARNIVRNPIKSH